jgi:single-stranded DNA-binding protein
MSEIEVALFGTLGRDAELKTSKSGKRYVRLNVRVGAGDQAQWVSVTSFDPDGIAVAEKLIKGARLYIEGVLGLDAWTAADGAKQTSLSVMSWHTQLAAIGRNKPRRSKSISVAGGESTERAARPQSAAPFHDDPIPFAPEWR